MDEKHLDSLLDEAVGAAPPEDVVRAVSPWRKAMVQVLWGLGLTAITFNFLGLNYILPSLGCALMLLGFRTLRGANCHFRLAYHAAALRCAMQALALGLGATAIRSEELNAALTVLSAIAVFGVTLGFWQGLIAAKAAVGLEPRAPAAGLLMLWYAAIYVLALVAMLLGGSISLLGVLMVAAFIGIVVSLSKLSRQLDEAGYAIEAAPVRLTDGQLCALLALIAAALMALGLLCFGHYHMDWEEQPARGEEAAAIAEKLLGLGMPEYVLADLADEDLLLCAEAEAVDAHVDEFSLDDGSALRSTGVAVRMPEEESWYEHWLLIQHFDWQGEASFPGTESIVLWAANRISNWWIDLKNPPHLRLLYTEDGESRVSSPAVCEPGDDGYTFSFGFSFPRGAEGARGYVCYSIEAASSVMTIVDSGINYRHQESLLQYPVRTALEGGRAFWLGQDALQFFSAEDGGVDFTS